MLTKVKHKPLVYLKNDYQRLQTSPSAWQLVLGLVAASALTIYPLHTPWHFFRPNFMFLLAIYWVVQYPKSFGLVFLFGVGLIADLLAVQLLGMNALLFPLSYYLLSKLYAPQHMRPIDKLYQAVLAWLLYAALVTMALLVFASFAPLKALLAVPLGLFTLLVLFVSQGPRRK